MGRFTLRLTADNIGTALKPGDVITDAEDLGPVKSARVTRDGFDNAMIVGERGRDVLGLPSTVEVTREG